VEDSFVTGKKLNLTKSGGSKEWKALDFNKWGSSLGTLQKFTPMAKEHNTSEIGSKNKHRKQA